MVYSGLVVPSRADRLELVLQRQEEIIQCFEDYQAGKMGAIQVRMACGSCCRCSNLTRGRRSAACVDTESQGAEERHAQAREAVAKQKETGKWKESDL